MANQSYDVEKILKKEFRDGEVGLNRFKYAFKICISIDNKRQQSSAK